MAALGSHSLKRLVRISLDPQNKMLPVGNVSVPKHIVVWKQNLMQLLFFCNSIGLENYRTDDLVLG